MFDWKDEYAYLICYLPVLNDLYLLIQCDIYIVGNLVEFNISWLRGGHPVVNVGDLSVEASEKLGLLLDQLRFPAVKALTSSVIVVLIKRCVAYSSRTSF